MTVLRPIEERFWQYTKKSEDDCWLWIGGTNVGGYGRLAIDSKGHYVVAHKISWIIHNGEVPQGLFVLHKCDNRPCVRPDHLYLGTAKDNARDRSDRGRGADRKGIKHPLARLTEEDVNGIVLLRLHGWKLQDIANLFGVSDSTVSAIMHKKRWNHITE